MRDFQKLGLDLSTLAFVGIFEAQAHGHSEGTLVRMTCYTANYSGQIKAAAEIEEARWLNYADQDKISAVDKLIFDHLKQLNLL